LTFRLFDIGVNFFVGDNNSGKSLVFETVDFISTKTDRRDMMHLNGRDMIIGGSVRQV